MKCILKKHTWFSFMRRGMISYNSYKLFVKKTTLVSRNSTGTILCQALRSDSLNYDMKRCCKVLNSLKGKNKKSPHKEFTVDEVSTNNTTKICNAFCNYFIYHPKNIHESIPMSTFHVSDQIEINERSMYFRDATETDIIESILHLNKEGGIKDISREFLFI